MTQQKMSYKQVQQKVYKIITDMSSVFGVFTLPKQITDESVLHEDFNFDSLDDVNFIMTIEKEFDIHIPEYITGHFNNVGDVVKYIYAPDVFCKERNISVISQYPEFNISVPDIPSKKTVPQPETTLKQALKNTDLSALAGKTVELNGYKIMIEQIKQNKR